MKIINLEKVRKLTDNHDKLREEVIRESRKVITLSKSVIYALQRDDFKISEAKTIEMAKCIQNLIKSAGQNGRLKYEGIFKVAIQEYVEALSLREFLKSGNLIEYSEEFQDVDNYLMGLCDVSGELVRKAINSSIRGNHKMAVKIRETLEALYTELSKFEFKNGELRRKYDGIKYDLKKMDDLVFELNINKKI